MYNMNQSMQVAKQATRDIEGWLSGLPETVAIENVEDNPQYQRVDVDLIWITQTGSYQVEIKGDRYHKTGNFFLETHSNKERNTPGCFLYTEADWVFYYFVTPRLLYQLPMPATRHWFLENINRFRERSTTTNVGNSYYTTVGRLVPINVVIAEVANIARHQL